MKAPFSFFKSSGAAAFNPATDGANLVAAYEHGNYALVSTTGTWTATAGTDVAVTSVNAPTATSGCPVWIDHVSAPLTNSVPASTFLGSGNCHSVAVVDFTQIDAGAGATYYQEAVWASNAGEHSLSVRREAGPTYFVDFAVYNGGFSVATVEVTSLVDGSGAGRLIIQTKISGGFTWIRVAPGAWIQGDAVSTPLGALTETLVVGTNYSGSFVAGQRILALYMYTSAQNDATFADLVAAWGGALT